ncbi:radical SAM family heme chaperone HemW [Fluviibacter phosphoraccumulans]|uniref:radical SAM family heme chaperone HemW n=1 Tax=Fluviibacter phosphoraccumulans TaxID=1751046 RepID=UPI0010B3D5B3|nr:coproporphyrinogen III oxidase [Fluviibacter phosphoraccumulans]
MQTITFVPSLGSRAAAAGALQPNFTQAVPLSLYVHIPWCARKCPYCDFNSHAAPEQLPENELVDALLQDLTLALPGIWGRRVETIFFGGGTPSLLSPAAIDRLITGFRTLLPLSPNAEITLEANPGTVDADRFAGFSAAGVNRLSLGIQSLNDASLHALGRIHDRAQAIAAIEAAAKHFDTFNLDLMVGLPQQDTAAALADINQALAFNPPHFSCYQLTLEPHTPFAAAPPANLPDDDVCAEIQDELEARLAAAGYTHYETSAFALPGHQCRHNLNYWTFGDYLGIGPGAHSKLTNHEGARRQMRYKSPKAYLMAATTGNFIQTDEPILATDLPGEFMMNALRLNEGFGIELFERYTGLPWLIVSRQVDAAIQDGFLEWVEPNQHLRPTLQGRRFLNVLLQRFL